MFFLINKLITLQISIGPDFEDKNKLDAYMFCLSTTVSIP